MTCQEFEAALSAYLENELPTSAVATMNAHALHCPSCAALLRDLRAITRDAQALPLLSPSRDLWSGIADRIHMPVTSISEHRVPVAELRLGRALSVRQLAVAALTLITVSSGVTYSIVHARATVATPTVAATSGDTTVPRARDTALALPSPKATASSGTGTGTGTAVITAAFSSAAVDRIYEREITSMRRIVDERLGDLDSATVREIERNLAIIDKAIADSRSALARDPHSGFLSTQLDRALETKLSTLRKVALL